MKKSDIPQDRSKLEDKNIRELNYAVDKDGKYTTGLSTGWEPKSIALDLTIENLNEQIEKARQKVVQGKKSPIYFYMWQSKMDVAVLSAYIGKSRWIVKRHFKPRVFKRLKKEVVEKYAEIFEIDVKKLQNFND